MSEADAQMACECCFYMKGQKTPAQCWMEWGEWLCLQCASEAIEDDSRRDLNASDED